MALCLSFTYNKEALEEGTCGLGVQRFPEQFIAIQDGHNNWWVEQISSPRKEISILDFYLASESACFCWTSESAFFYLASESALFYLASESPFFNLASESVFFYLASESPFFYLANESWIFDITINST